MFLGFFTLAIVMISQLYRAWQNNPVMTTVSDPDFSVTKLDFPAIVICGQGATDNRLERVLNYTLQASSEWIDSDSNQTGTNPYASLGFGSLHPTTIVKLFTSLSPRDFAKYNVLVKNNYDKPCNNDAEENTSCNHVAHFDFLLPSI